MWLENKVSCVKQYNTYVCFIWNSDSGGIEQTVNTTFFLIPAEKVTKKLTLGTKNNRPKLQSITIALTALRVFIFIFISLT